MRADTGCGGFGGRGEGLRLTVLDQLAQSSIQCFIRREQVYKRNKRLNHCRVGRQEAAARMALKPFEILEELPQYALQLLGSFSGDAERGTPYPAGMGIWGHPDKFLPTLTAVPVFSFVFR